MTIPRAVRIWFIRPVLTLVAGTALVGAFLGCTAWRRLAHLDPPTDIRLAAPIMTAVEYENVIQTHRRPYVYELRTPNGGAVLMYGAEHSKNPTDPQFTDIRNEWTGFRPTVALCESTLGILFPQFMDPVREFGEPGFVHALAREANIPTYIWEPKSDTVVALLLATHSQQRVAARFILGPYFSNLRHGRPTDPNAFVEEYRRKRNAWPGLEGTFDSVAAIDAFWKGEFPTGPDWRDVSDEYGLPGFLADMDLNTPRDEHFAAVLIDFARQGERVFAIAGSGHAVKLEPALRASLLQR